MTKPEDNRQLTVIIPVYNRRNIIGRTLDSLAGQTACREVGFIFVDNSSDDGTPDVIREWMDRNPEIPSRLLFEREKGAPAARNLGFRNVDTPWVMFFDSDDIMLPEHLETVLASIKENPDADIIGWGIDQQLASGRWKRTRFSVRNPMRGHLVHAILATQRYAVKSSFFRKSGGWDNSVRGWNDYELGVRLLVLNPALVGIDGRIPQVKTYFSDISITGKSFSDNPDKWEHPLNLIERTLESYGPEYIRWVDYRRAVLAAEYRREGDRGNARRLLGEAKKNLPFAATLIYAHHLLFHRGAHILARIILGNR